MSLNAASWNLAKIFLAAASPLQRFLDGGGFTHLFLNEQALIILENDGYKTYARYLNNFMQLLNRGCLWADKGWKNFAHYFNISTHNGIWPWPDAAGECIRYYNQALNWWRKGNLFKSFFFLGAALHLVQDLCVPYHACGIAFAGHHDYELWVQANFRHYQVFDSGVYRLGRHPEEWVTGNAKLAQEYYRLLAEQRTPASYDYVTSKLLPRAQQTSAGFLAFFIEQATMSAGENAISLPNKTNQNGLKSRFHNTIEN